MWKTYLLFFILFATAQCFAMWGAYVSLPLKKLSMWQAYKMAMPFVLIDWFLMTFVINLSTKYNLVTPTQNIFILIILQFIIILVINHFYLKQQIYLSDYIAFLLLLIGYAISYLKLFSGLCIRQHIDSKKFLEKYNFIR